jgi:hypothetical protein
MMKRVFLTAVCLTTLLLTGTAAFADVCYAEKSCPGGHTVQCSDTTTGTSTCSVLSNGVQCATTGTITCPQVTTGCPAQYTCPTTVYSQPWVVYCNGSSCSKDPINHSVTCDGTTSTCDYCEYWYNRGLYACLTGW